MKRMVISMSLLSGLALADTFTGTLVDVMCQNQKKDLASHTKDCAIKCSKSGYGLVTSEGKFLKFDSEGNDKALEALKATSREKDLKAEVTGDLEDETLKVETIKIA